jgi:hypothetical protein
VNEIEDLAHRLTEGLKGYMRPEVPLSVALWDIKTIALYLRRHENYTRQSVVTLPTFPHAIRLPLAGKEGHGQPLWRAKDVISWAESHMQT